MNYEGKTNEELIAMDEAIRADPKNQIPRDTGSVWLYTAEAIKKLDKIGRAITNNMIAKKKAEGTYINDDGYSGRQTKRGVG